MNEIERKFIATPLAKYINSTDNLQFGAIRATFENAETQLNLYYASFDGDIFFRILTKTNAIKQDQLKIVRKFLDEIKGLKVSLRARKIDDSYACIVVKASTKDVINGTNRRELDIEFDPRLFDEVDAVLSEQFKIDSKWNRTRNNYSFDAVVSTKKLKGNITLDQNSGYGLLGEVELLVDDTVNHDDALELVDSVIVGAGFKPLDVSRVNEWYTIYCTMWERFYRTGKTFADFEDTAHLFEE